MTRVIEYNNAAFELRLEYPPAWRASSLTGVKLGVHDRQGTALEALTAATIIDLTWTLQAAGSIGDESISIDSDAAGILPGDRFRIADSTTGQHEDVVVAYYAGSGVVYLVDELEHAHTNGTAIKPMWCTYDLDTATDTGTWTKSLPVTIEWEPQGTDDPSITESGVVLMQEYLIPDLYRKFRINYPMVYEIYNPDDIDDLFIEARRIVALDLEKNNRTLAVLVETESAIPAVLSQMAYIGSSGQGKEWTDNRMAAGEDYAANLSRLTASARFYDANQDKDEDVAEVGPANRRPMVRSW